MDKRNLSEEDLESLLSALTKSTRGPSAHSAEQSYSDFEKRLSEPKVKRLPIYKYIAAASVILIVSLSAYFLQLLGQPQMITVSTTSQIKEVVLSDGTHITLSRYSTLQYPEKFNASTREVTLTGQGFFDVAKDPEHPFIVSASEVKVKVLGTQFNIQSYPNDSYIKTTLIEGKVSMSNLRNSDAVILKPNQYAVFSKKTGNISLQNIENALDNAAWKSGILLFNNESLSQIAGELSNYFNVSIKIQDTGLDSYKLTARFEHDEGLDDILDLLQIAGNFRWSKNGNEILINKN